MRNEFLRKMIHIALGLGFMYSIHIDFLKTWMLIVSITIGLVLSFISHKKKIPFVSHVLNIVDKNDKWPGKGAINYFIGVLIVFILFSDKNVVLGAIAVLAFGDSIAAITGLYFPKTKNPLNENKSLEGSIAGLTAAVVASSFFVSPFGSFLGSFLAMIVEALDLKVGRLRIDDNVFLPLVSGIVFFLIG